MKDIWTLGLLPLFLSALLSPLITQVAEGQQAEERLITIYPSSDAYVVADLNDPVDSLGLRKISTGNLPFLKIWYASNVTGGGEGKNIITVAYLKFDLSEIKTDEIRLAKLKLYAQNITLISISAAVDIHSSESLDWNESELTFSDAPAFDENPIATSRISSTGLYEWNVTSFTREHAGSEITLIVLLRDNVPNSEEQVIFLSKESDNAQFRPSLLVEIASSTPLGDGITLSSNRSPFFSIAIGIGVLGAAIVLPVVILIYRRSGQRRNSNKLGMSSRSGQASNIPTATSTNIITNLLCASCSKEVSKQFRVCPFCGNDLMQGTKCGNCGKHIFQNYNVCPFCAAKIKSSES